MPDYARPATDRGNRASRKPAADKPGILENGLMDRRILIRMPTGRVALTLPELQRLFSKSPEILQIGLLRAKHEAKKPKNQGRRRKREDASDADY